MEEIVKKLNNELKVIGYEYVDDTLIIDIKSCKKSDFCPCCGKESSKIHSRYMRSIKDLPIQEYKVILNINANVFFCKNNNCNTKTFAEHFDFIECNSRMTTRLRNKIIENSKGMSARASKVVINNGLVNISDDTILRLLKKNNKFNR